MSITTTMPQNHSATMPGTQDNGLNRVQPDSSGESNDRRNRNNPFSRCRQFLSFLNILSCGYKTKSRLLGKFNGVEDSVHVMLRHDKERANKVGQTTKGYTPRKPLSSVLAEARQNDHAVVIKATEDDEESETDKKLLAALADDGGSSRVLTQ